MSKRDYDTYNDDDLNAEILNLKSSKKAKKEYYTESDFEDEFDDDLYGDEEDRNHLKDMPDLEREQILHKRFSEREKLQERKKRAIEMGMFKTKKEVKHKKSTKKVKQQSALSDLKEKRERQKQRNSSPKRKSSQNFYKREVINGDEDEDEDEEPFKIEMTLEDIQHALVNRSQLEKWCTEPYFEDLVVGTFVKVLIGEENNIRLYRLAYVDSIKKKRVYKLGNTTTPKHLTLRHANTIKAFPMDRISNQPISPIEFNYWKTEMEKHRRIPPTVDEILKKKKEISNIHNYSYTSKDIIKRMREGNKYDTLPLVSLNSEKRSLEDLKTKQELKGDTESEEYFNICSDLERVEKILRQRSQQPKTESSISIINKKNKMKNRNKKAKKVKKTTDGLDPFARQITRSSLFFGFDEPEIKKKEVEVEQVKKVILSPGAALEKKHNFELDGFASTIDNLTKKSAEKPVVVATTTTTTTITKTTDVQKTVTKSGKKCLSLADYKRRRGLIE